jgi:hypothetical protein
MGKRSSFERNPRDWYPTPREAVAPLLPHLSPGTQFVEPCAGDGALIDALALAGHRCTYAFDIEPQRYGIHLGDARIELSAGYGADCFITNPPWDRRLLHPIIINLSNHLPTWLLFDADWIHTRQSAPFMDRLRAIVSVGRVKWIPDSTMTGKDNCCWYLFGAPDPLESSVFYGRLAA